MHNIAVLITCFNRRENTLRCLSSLLASFPTVEIYLVDDGSTDGTAQVIGKSFPSVHIIKSDGNLFWNRGMHLAWANASKSSYNYYLWLNDDVVLRKNCIEELLNCAIETSDKAIISGIIDSHDHSMILYGASNSKKSLLQANGKMQSIFNMNGNVVLVPKAVFEILGNLDPVLHHDLGDVDYGYRAAKAGIAVLTTREVVGSCDKNEVCRVRLQDSTIVRRFAKLYSPLGNHPRINFYFRRQHFGLLNALMYYLHIHAINFLPDIIIRRIFGERYFH